jgi:hypothetical protein
MKTRFLVLTAPDPTGPLFSGFSLPSLLASLVLPQNNPLDGGKTPGFHGERYVSTMGNHPLTVVQDPADRCAVIQHYIPSLLARLEGPPGPSLVPPVVIAATLVQDSALDCPQSAHPAAHLDFRTTIQFQHGLGKVSEEVVDAIPVRHPGKLSGNRRNEGILFVRHPQSDRFAQSLGPAASLNDQLADLRGGAGEQ